jgi:hypothetical protein
MLDEKTLEDKLRIFFDSEVKQVEPSSQWWDHIISEVAKPVQSVSFRGKIAVVFPESVRIALPLAVVLITICVLWGMGILPRLAGLVPSSATFAPGPSSSASYVSSFRDMGELCNSSDVIVIGTVEKVIDVKPAEWGHGTVYGARSLFRVGEVLKGNIDKEIVLKKMALKDEDHNIWLEGSNVDPPFQAGEKWVLFLSAELSYNTLGPWGRYKIIDDKVYSMNRVANDNNAYGNEMDFNGVPLAEFIAGINQTLDSVVLTFTDSRIPWAIDRGERISAGWPVEVNVNLATGKYGPDTVTYTVKRIPTGDSHTEIPMPEGLNTMIEPAQFAAAPRNEYTSTLEILTTCDLPLGTYWIRVEYQFGESTGFQVFTLHVD